MNVVGPVYFLFFFLWNFTHWVWHHGKTSERKGPVSSWQRTRLWTNLLCLLLFFLFSRFYSNDSTTRGTKPKRKDEERVSSVSSVCFNEKRGGIWPGSFRRMLQQFFRRPRDSFDWVLPLFDESFSLGEFHRFLQLFFPFNPTSRSTHAPRVSFNVSFIRNQRTRLLNLIRLTNRATCVLAS